MKKQALEFLLLVTLFSTGGAASVFSQTTQNNCTKETQESGQAIRVAVPVVVAGKFKVKPEKRELFLKLAKEALEPTRQEPDLISYSFYEESTNPNNFFYFEEWKNRKALDAHLEKPYTKRLLDRFSEILDGKGNIRVYDVKSVNNL